jgi:hypothetical protein
MVRFVMICTRIHLNGEYIMSCTETMSENAMKILLSEGRYVPRTVTLMYTVCYTS